MGSIAAPVPVSQVMTDPPGIISGKVFTYLDRRYVPVDMIQPGSGYWIKLNQAGRLILAAPFGYTARFSPAGFPIGTPPPH